MNFAALLTVAVVVGWLATLIVYSEIEQVCLLDFAIAICGAGLAGGLVAPLLGISATGEYGLSLSGTIASGLGATLLLAVANLLRFGKLRHNDRPGENAGSRRPPARAQHDT